MTTNADLTGAARPVLLVRLHWATVTLLTVAVVAALVRNGIDGRDWRAFLLGVHRQAGLCVLALALWRVLLRLSLGRLPHLSASSRSQLLAASAVHWALYAVMFALPLIGWALSNAHGQSLHWFYLPLPALVEADDDIADELAVWHVDVAWCLLGLLVMHVAAALWHHYLKKDASLLAMRLR
jgi:cytochrome b561